MLKVGITCGYMYQSALNMDQHEPNTKEVLVKAFGSLLLGITRRITRLSYLSSSLFPSGKLPLRM